MVRLWRSKSIRGVLAHFVDARHLGTERRGLGNAPTVALINVGLDLDGHVADAEGRGDLLALLVGIGWHPVSSSVLDGEDAAVVIGHALRDVITKILAVDGAPAVGPDVVIPIIYPIVALVAAAGGPLITKIEAVEPEVVERSRRAVVARVTVERANFGVAQLVPCAVRELCQPLTEQGTSGHKKARSGGGYVPALRGAAPAVEASRASMVRAETIFILIG